MGDRGNIYVVDPIDESRGVYLYTHWDGSNLPKILQSALKRGKGRWDDSQYLCRIIFCEMIANDVWGTTDYGISATLGDGGGHILRVDINHRSISYGEHEFAFVEFEKLESFPDW